MDTVWDPRAERMSADERADLQARRLDDLLTRLAGGSPFYRDRLAAAGVEVRDTPAGPEWTI